MIKLLNILSELEVRKRDLYEQFREYMRSGSKGYFILEISILRKN